MSHYCKANRPRETSSKAKLHSWQIKEAHSRRLRWNFRAVLIIFIAKTKFKRVFIIPARRAINLTITILNESCLAYGISYSYNCVPFHSVFQSLNHHLNSSRWQANINKFSAICYFLVFCNPQARLNFLFWAGKLFFISDCLLYPKLTVYVCT